MKYGAASRTRDAARRAFADDEAKSRRKTRRAPLFVKLDEAWTRNRKLRATSPIGVLLFLALVAIAGRRARAGVLSAADVGDAWDELGPWRQDQEREDVLEELEAANLVVLVAGGLELVGWTREEWSAGWRRESSDPCPRCRGARTVAPGFRSCEQCRDRDRARWSRRKGVANLARRSGPERDAEDREKSSADRSGRSDGAPTAPRTAPRERSTSTPLPLLFAKSGPAATRSTENNNNNNSRRRA